LIQNCILILNFVIEEESWTFWTYIDIRSQAFYVDNNGFSESMYIVEDSTSDVEVGDTWQTTSRIFLNYDKNWIELMIFYLKLWLCPQV